jgi:hypothetical protein
MSSKEEREKFMSDEDRVAAAQKHGSRCEYCHGQNMIETVTDRLFMCCNECAEWDAKNPVVVKELPCVICGYKIKPECGPDEINTINVDSISFDDGAAAKISYGYGCHLDGNVYMIAICKDCTEQAQAAGRLILVYNYIP